MDRVAAMKGFTLLETLVALAVFGLFVAGLLHAERGFRRALEDEDLALREQRKQAVVELLRAELRMAGYRHDGPDIAVQAVRGSDRVTFRYLEDRTGGEPTVRTVGFDAGVDGNGVASLYRKEGTGTRQPAVLGLRELRVAAWIDRGTGARTAAAPPRPAAIVLGLRFAWDERVEVTIGLPNGPTYEAAEGA